MIKLLFTSIIYFLPFISTIYGLNKYPIVLVHGFIGWGPDEMGGYPYWGGELDLEKYLESLGYDVFTVSVGPVSSNWERSIEIFHQLKGGQVDYGKKHADTWGIIQKPHNKHYIGLYPQWNESNPLHFIGHSMGGQTIRMLSYQLNNLFFIDSTHNVLEESKLLNSDNSGWIKSITSISTPHNGTTLSDIVIKSVPFLQNFIILGAVVQSDFYDFDLQHWGFSRKDKESWLSYFNRLRNHPSWNTKNICSWELGLDGAQALNTKLIAQQNVYYFSFSTSTTHKEKKTDKHKPDKNTSLFLRIKSKLIGSQIVRFEDGTITDSLWFENDGVVNTISQNGPTTGLNGPDPLANYHQNEPLIPGQWYVLPTVKMDHWGIIGHGNLNRKEKEFLLSLYDEHCERLWSLPK